MRDEERVLRVVEKSRDDEANIVTSTGNFRD
jgi:hypothetical protein